VHRAALLPAPYPAQQKKTCAVLAPPRGVHSAYRETHLRVVWWSAGLVLRLSVCLTPSAPERVPVLSSSEFDQSIAEAARTLNKPRSLDDTLQTIVEVARNSVPGFDHVGIATVEKKGTIETKAFVGALVLTLDKLQYSLAEGPCSAALQGSEAMSVSNLQHEQRWPHYVPQALGVGVRSQMAIKLYLDEDTLGGINFYSTTSDDVSPDAQALARLFATHAAIALGHAQERESLTEGLQTRGVIGQAIGILMERYEMNDDRAFAFLVRASSHKNIKLRAVAHELVSEANAR
jgi:GAF domain-containing protein